MKYVFQFGIVWDHLPQLHRTVRGSRCACRSAHSRSASRSPCVLAFLRTRGRGRCASLVAAYVEFIRNTPFLVQLFIIYFSLPAIGIRMEAMTAALVGMSLNFSGYATEIIRSGIEAVPRSQIEAGQSLGFDAAADLPPHHRCSRRCAPCIRRSRASSSC